MKTLLHFRMFIAVQMAMFVLLATLARAQNSPQPRLVFSAPITEAQCRDFPSADFKLEPAGNRWKSRDSLNVRCGFKGHSPISLTLTVTIDVKIPSGPRGVRGEVFKFYWGESINAPTGPFAGQFTHNPDLCSRLAGLLNSRVLRFIAEDSARVHQVPELSSSCEGEDLWGTVMVIVVTSDFSDLPFKPLEERYVGRITVNPNPGLALALMLPGAGLKYETNPKHGTTARGDEVQNLRILLKRSKTRCRLA